MSDAAAGLFSYTPHALRFAFEVECSAKNDLNQRTCYFDKQKNRPTQSGRESDTYSCVEPAQLGLTTF